MRAFRLFLAATTAAIPMTVAMSAPAAAQETTSAVRGIVTSDGAPVAGAEVTVRHEPSGTVSTTTTGADGSFSASGLRVGGPFTVSVSAAGFESAQVTELTLSAGQPFRLPIELRQAEEIVITASSIAGASATSSGPITTLGRTEIEGVASINRDIRDAARRDPFVTLDLTNSRTIEIAGNNGRLNRFSVDGVQFSDDFGLNNGGLPTSRGPVPFDAIEQLSVKVAPYDISEGDFQGGAVNVVLRSGGNRFKGSAFYTYTDENLTGDKSKGVPINLEFDSKQYGGFLSGPIVKDKLFFALAYEKTDESDPFDSGPQGGGFADPVPNLTQAQVDQVSSIAQTVYGYDTLGVIRNGVEKDEKFVAKIDWNVSDDHRASLTYIRNEGSQANQRNTDTRTGSPQLGLFSTGYELTEEINSGVFQLNSTWSDNFTTELRASYRDYNRGQIPYGEKTAGEITVCLDPTSVGSATSCTPSSPGVPATARVTFGPDVFRHANALNTENLSVDFKAALQAGDHALKFITGYTKIDVFNLFVPRSLGAYYFDSIADFQNGRAGQLVLANAVPSLDPDDGAAEFSTEIFSFGLQDDWQATDTLLLTLGARVDLYSNDQTPPLNANFLARNGFSNRETFNGLAVFQPRFGFNWEPTDRIIVRGGVGVFSGGTPDVFLSNSYSNTGQLTNEVTIRRDATCATVGSLCDSALNGITDFSSFSPTVTNFLATNIGALAGAPVNAIDPDLDLPSQMKASLSFDYDADLGPLGDGWLFGVEALYSENINGFDMIDLRSTVNGTLPDGRPRYRRNPLDTSATGNNNADLVLINSERGKSLFGVFRFAKAWDFGLSIDGSYTRQDVKDVNPITSATASSLYGNAVFVDPNVSQYGRSIYEIRDTWKFSVDFKRAFFGDYDTRFSLFGEYRSGRPYSLTMRDLTSGRSAVFGTTGSNDRYLLYVPTVGDSRVSFDSVASETAFNNLVANLGLEKYRGRIVPKNSETSPDFFKIDLHVEQELPTFVGDSRIKLFADIENVLNLIDSDWGALRQVAFPYRSATVNVQCLSVATPTGTAPAPGVVNTVPTQTCAQYRYSSVTAPNETLVGRQSLYQIRVGVRFEF
jgi:outer membrane receptor for ferrienterochelin and colicin